MRATITAKAYCLGNGCTSWADGKDDEGVMKCLPCYRKEKKQAEDEQKENERLAELATKPRCN